MNTESQQTIARETTDDFCRTHTQVITRWAKGDLEQAFLDAIEKAVMQYDDKHDAEVRAKADADWREQVAELITEHKDEIAEVEMHNIAGTISPEALVKHDAEVREQAIKDGLQAREQKQKEDMKPLVDALETIANSWQGDSAVSPYLIAKDALSKIKNEGK